MFGSNPHTLICLNDWANKCQPHYFLFNFFLLVSKREDRILDKEGVKPQKTCSQISGSVYIRVQTASSMIIRTNPTDLDNYMNCKLQDHNIPVSVSKNERILFTAHITHQMVKTISTRSYKITAFHSKLTYDHYMDVRQVQKRIYKMVKIPK